MPKNDRKQTGQRRGKTSLAQRKREVRRNRIIFLVIAATLLVSAGIGIVRAVTGRKTVTVNAENPEMLAADSIEWIGAPDITVDLLTPNDYSRPQIALQQVRGIVIHYTANPGSTAKDNRDYFESLKDTQENQASSHFIVGLDGEVLQCIPSAEISYASNDRNSDTLSIECCHPDESGQFQQATYDSVVQLTGWLCVRFDVPVSEVIRHYDVTGKLCPKYFVEHEDAWTQFRADVQSKIDEIQIERENSGK